MEKLFSVTLGERHSDLYFTPSLDSLWNHLATLTGRSLFVADTNTAPLLPLGIEHLILPSGEEEKGWASVVAIVKRAKELGFGRDDSLVALGGGVIGDITAFAASLYMRGCQLILVPTTLLAMVDATLGGKTAIDFDSSKNFLGTFYPAQQIYLVPQVLQTLPMREYKNGLAEVVKHALISQDAELLLFLEKNYQEVKERDENLLKELLYKSLLVKKGYIEQDPFETKGIREVLNFGHTFGHALEVLGNFSRYSHGEAVAWGMRRALLAGLELGITPKEFVKRALALLELYSFSDFSSNLDKPAFLVALQSDKKKRSSQVRFVLLRGVGNYQLTHLSNALIESLIE